MAINRHKISQDVINSKQNDNEFKLRMRNIENSIHQLEKRHLIKFDTLSTRETNIEHEINSTNNSLQDCVFELKKLIGINSDRIVLN